MSASLNSEPVLELSLHLPLNGAWSAEVQVGSDVELEVDQVVSLKLLELELTGRVVRASIFAERLRVRLTGGELDWSAPVALKHYKTTTVGTVLADLELAPDASATTALPFWTRKGTTAGEATQSLATMLGVNWRVNPDGSLRIRAEAPTAVEPDAVEVSRDAARGIVEIAPEFAVVLPGTLVGDDQVGDVLYEYSAEQPLRCRYYTEQRARLRGALERLIRWMTRDALYLGTYTAAVVSQAADGTLDLMPDDARLRADGLQSVPIRHGLPGCTVEVAAGERVLLAFDGGDSRAPYAALWHPGQVIRVNIGGSEAVALAALVSARLDAIQAAFDAHTHLHSPGPGAPAPTAPPASPIGPLEPVAAEILHTA
jgi:hypothetical protein